MSILNLQCCVNLLCTAKLLSYTHTHTHTHTLFHYDFSSVTQLCRLFVTPWTAALQASLSVTDFQSLFKFMSTQSVMSSNHLIFCCPLLLLPSIFPSIRIFSNESVLHIRWSKYLASVPPMNIQRVGSIPGLGRSPGAGNSNPLQYSCLGNTHGQGSLADYGA